MNHPIKQSIKQSSNSSTNEPLNRTTNQLTINQKGAYSFTKEVGGELGEGGNKAARAIESTATADLPARIVTLSKTFN